MKRHSNQNSSVAFLYNAEAKSPHIREIEMTCRFAVCVFFIYFGNLAHHSVKAEDLHCVEEQNDSHSVCYKFVRQPLNWTEAQKFCQKNGQHLLRTIDWRVQKTLSGKLERDKAWWVEQHQASNKEQHGTSKSTPKDKTPFISGSEMKSGQSDQFSFCTYVILDPVFKLISSSNCSQLLFFICQLNPQDSLIVRKRSLVVHGDVLSSALSAGPLAN
ncbi:polycystic kidney disease protein 1-like 2 [Erpetoichthys calabaricus]|uniref:polycystic kidney disease protein 1-like 2 n=1 Tax=Erpetoichthys calabaricus TaxID=27687 RepID=UPI00223456FA|nr:polycystic kidney disease protein 1-like 2 [Erpetoichthys calabaricus]